MAGLKTGPTTKGLSKLFIPSSILLVSFTGFSSQWLFNTSANLAPGPLTTTETIILNALIFCVFWTYFRACTVPAGHYDFPSSTQPSSSSSPSLSPSAQTTKPPHPQRWCRKCARSKPLRAHHCRHCNTCIPRMDHHCPWTANCVSLQTFPHFLRFLLFSNISLWALFYLLTPRLLSLWEIRNLPAYLGPGTARIVHLILLALVGAGSGLSMFVLLWTTVKGWVVNCTMIEEWEVERHEAVLERARRGGIWWDGTGGEGGGNGKMPERVEFPYDVGLFENMAQAMGTRNVLLWFWPFAGGPKVSKTGKGSGWEWEENGFNATTGMWPPVDPEKVRREALAARKGEGKERSWPGSEKIVAAQLGTQRWLSVEEEKHAFQERQRVDLLRLARPSTESEPEASSEDSDEEDDFEIGMDGEPGWMNSDGDRLRDYGVDEDADGAEADSEEDIPISDLLRKRKASKPNR